MRNDPSGPAIAPARIVVLFGMRTATDARAMGASLFASTILPLTSPFATGAWAGAPAGRGVWVCAVTTCVLPMTSRLNAAVSGRRTVDLQWKGTTSDACASRRLARDVRALEKWVSEKL